MPSTRPRPGACDTGPLRPVPRLASALRARGIRTVSGDLVGDGSYFEPTHGTPRLGGVRPQLVVRRAGLGARIQRQQRGHPLGAGCPGRRAGRHRAEPRRPDRTGAREPDPDRPPPANGHDHRLLPQAGHPRTLGRGHGRRSSSRGGTEYFAMPDPDLFAAECSARSWPISGIAVARHHAIHD